MDKKTIFNVPAAQVLWDSGRRGKSVQHLPWGLKHREVAEVVNCQNNWEPTIEAICLYFLPM